MAATSGKTLGVIDAVIFDWGGTLTPWHTIDVLEGWRTVLQSPPLARRVFEAEKLAWTWARDDHRSARLADILASCGVVLSDAQLAGYEQWWEPHTFTDPDAASVFAALRERGIRIGLLSNTVWTREYHERILARDGVLDCFDGSVYTSEIEWTKPHPSAFRAALDAVGVQDPAHAVFVGDRPFDDIHGAKAVGMRAVLLPHSDIPDWQRGSIVGEPDAVIARLSDLVAVVDDWLAVAA